MDKTDAFPSQPCKSSLHYTVFYVFTFTFVLIRETQRPRSQRNELLPFRQLVRQLICPCALNCSLLYSSISLPSFLHNLVIYS